MSTEQGDRVVCRLRFQYEGRERVFTVSDRPVVIGRSPDSDLLLAHDSISRQHARLAFDDEGWTLTDLDSKNGSRVNTFHVKEQVLRNGDRIDLGSIRMFAEIGPESAASRARVIFDENKAPAMHTEVLDLQGLDHLLQAAGDRTLAPQPSPFTDKDVLGGMSDDLMRTPVPEGGTSPELLRLVSESAESLLSCTTLPETLDRILSLVFANIPVERGVICLYDEQSGGVEPMAMRNREGVPDVPIAISTNITGVAIEEKQAVLIKDTAMDERFGAAESVIMMDIHSAMCAPLLRDDNVSGYIYVDRQSSAHPFDMPQLQALSILALLAAIAVEQAGLRDDVRREQERRVRLARYSSPAVVERIIADPEAGMGSMVADEGDVSVLFADLTGFTTMAERLPPSEVVLILNQVFERLTSAVFALDGTLDKFRGDGMMAFFGAPLPMADHAERAVEAALQMQEALSRLNQAREGVRPIRMRIGVNSGSVVVGDIGSPARTDYTVIGDVVNVASRLESSVAQPGQVVIGESTWEAVRHAYTAEALEEVMLKGKRQGVRPYRVTGRIGSDVGPTRAL
ncbi:MAG: adenylate/guanylate cyclase domain-containing protein [Myxococcota bacterium]